MRKTRAKKTHCKRGHEFTKENTRTQITEGTPRRICKACKREWANKNYQEYEKVENPRANQNDGKTTCIHGHEFTEENTGHKDGHRFCKECCRRLAREAGRAAEARYRALKRSDPVRWKEERRRRRAEALRRSGWTIEQFESALSDQRNLCAVCKTPLDLNAKKRGAGNQACADHEHTIPPKPREVLCVNCNLGIGNLKENPEIMLAAIAYVRKWKEG